MPGYKTHLAGGVISFAALSSVITISKHCFVSALLLCLLGSLFPDVDIKSKGQRIFAMVWVCLLMLLLLYKQYTAFAGMSLLGAAPLLAHHRGLFHAPWFLVSVSVALYVIFTQYAGPFSAFASVYAMSFACGAFSHIFLDRIVSAFKRRW